MRRSGAGLGLSIVRSVAEAHGGGLTLRARPQGGLVATVALPAARQDARGDADPSEEGYPGDRARAHA